MKKLHILIVMALLAIFTGAESLAAGDGMSTSSNVSFETFTVNGVSFKMIIVEGGTFIMGTTDDVTNAEDDEKPVHSVTLSSFSIGETEVTQELWTAVMGSNPSYYADNWQYPVEEVSWYDCQSFISKLNELTGRQFRLPTEAEWEYAARGGNMSQGYQYAGSNNYFNVMWCAYNIIHATEQVATKSPNELGIYDMSGNVWEWCQDRYGSYGSEAQTDPTGPESGTGLPQYCRVSSRSYEPPTTSTNLVGVRLALTVESMPEPAEQTEAPVVQTWTGTHGDHTQYVRIDAAEEGSELQYRYKLNDGDWCEWMSYYDVLEFTDNGYYEMLARAKADGKEWSDPVSVNFEITHYTGLNEINGEKATGSIRYFNAFGQEMAQPQGITIMVITYTDGTTSTVKVMK